MRILTVSATPYLLTRLGRINAKIIKKLKEDGHVVASAVWHHDPSWFVPEHDGKYNYCRSNGEIVCELFPFINIAEQSSPQVYEIMKKFKPDIVISIGDYQEIDFMFAIKALHPKLFKWYGVVTVDALPLQAARKEAFKFMDSIITTSQKAQKAIEELTGFKVEYIPFGPNHQIFKQVLSVPALGNLRVMNVGKNSQSSNTAAFIKGLSLVASESNIRGYLHTNVSDKGDYDLQALLDRYKANIAVPTAYVGLNDGLSNEDLWEEYSKSDVIVDTSVRAATGLTLLEGMACGCIPVGVRVGAIEEIINKMPEEYRFFVNSYQYVGAMEEEYEVISPDHLAQILLKLEKIKQNNLDVFKDMSIKAREVASSFSDEAIPNYLKELLKNDGNKKNANLSVEIL